MTSSSQPKRSVRDLAKPARALLRGAGPSLGVVAATAFAQRLALPLAALWLGEKGERAAAGVLLVAALSSFVRARAADRLARVVRLQLVDLFTWPLARGEVVPPPAADRLSTRLATTMPVLVSWAVDGVAVVFAALVALPLVTALLASALGLSALVPLVAAGTVGALVTMASASRVEAAWGRAFDHARALLSGASAGLSGAVELVAHGQAQVFLDKLKDDVRAWSSAELGARTASALSSWGALVSTLAAALGAASLTGTTFALAGGDRDVYRAFLLVFSAIPTLQLLLSGIASLSYAHEELLFVKALLDEAETSPGMTFEVKGKTLDPRAEIRLDQVSFTYPAREGALATKPAVRSISLELKAGESLAILGPNGSGKTTLLYLLLGLARPNEGSMLVGGEDVSKSGGTFGGRVAFVSQKPFEPPDATIAEALRAFQRDATDEQLHKALVEVGLSVELDRPLVSLSRGQHRRSMIARALVQEADLVVLDEPEAHLDEASVKELGALLRRLAKDKRVIAAIHDRAAIGFAHRVIELEP